MGSNLTRRCFGNIVSRRFNIPSLKSLARWLVLLVALTLILKSLSESWFDVPLKHESLSTIGSRTSTSQLYFKLFLVVGTIAVAALRCYQCRWTTIGSMAAGAILLLTAAFPFSVMRGNPELAADATLLQMYHDDLTWLGGDISCAAESSALSWKSKTYFIDPPRQLVVSPLPTWSIWDVELSHISDVLTWTGYSNVFCQFVRRGWFLAMLGATLLTTVTWFDNCEANLRRVGLCIAFLTLGSLVGTTFALNGPFLAKSHLANVAKAIGEGDYEQARQDLILAGDIFPSLVADSHYSAQRGIIDCELGLATEYTELHRARIDESNGRYDQSYQRWLKLSELGSGPVYRESIRAILRFAVQDYNCLRIQIAKRRFEYVLSHQPANVKAIYFLQVLSIRECSPTDTYRLCDWMYVVSDHYNFGTTKILKSNSQQNAKLASALAGDTHATWARMIAEKNP